MHTTNTGSKLPFFGFGSTNGRDDNHNDKSNTSFYNKDSSIAALEAFQREYLPSVSYPGSISQRIPSTLSSSSSARPGSPPSPTPAPHIFSSPGTGSLDSFQHNHSFDEQFKDLYEIDDNPRRKEFLDELFSFMQKRGTPINRLPVMAKHVLDLYELFNLVVEKGGLVEVINKKQWQEIIRDLKLPSSITSAAFTLRTQYTRYLYPYECKMKNLSKPSDLNLAVEGQRREGRRGYDEGPTPMLFPGPGGGPGSPFPYPLPVPLLRPPGSEPGGEPRLPMLPPSSLTSSSLNPLDVTRLTLMKIMGQNQLNFLPPHFPKIETRTSSTDDQLQSPSPSKMNPKDNNNKEQREDNQKHKEEVEDDDDKKKLMVCIEVNSVKYQGILFAQPIKNGHS